MDIEIMKAVMDKKQTGNAACLQSRVNIQGGEPIQ
jgi:hypothetical protein